MCAGKGQAIVRSESGEEMLTSDNIILSCGSSSASFPGLAPDGDAVLDSTGVLNLPESRKASSSWALGPSALSLATSSA